MTTDLGPIPLVAGWEQGVAGGFARVKSRTCSRNQIREQQRKEGELMEPKNNDNDHRGNGKITMRCPFHEEQTPSMVVDVSNHKFRCFSCGAQGEAKVIVTLYRESDYAELVL